MDSLDRNQCRERWVLRKGAQGEMGREKTKEEDNWEMLNRKVVQGCFSHVFCHGLIFCVKLVIWMFFLYLFGNS